MDSCACCEKSIEESNSSRCYGFACEQRLCYQCYEEKNGYCPECEASLKRDPMKPNRSIPEKAGRVFDWMTGLADGAMKREVEIYEGEFDMYEDEDDVREMIKARYKELPEWKKKIFRAKKKTEMMAARAALKTYTKGSKVLGDITRMASSRFADDYDHSDDIPDDEDDQYKLYEKFGNVFDSYEEFSDYMWETEQKPYQDEFDRIHSYGEDEDDDYEEDEDLKDE
jgi:hypothetical protein